jgi:DNA-binding PadR family transcriptional regulator
MVRRDDVADLEEFGRFAEPALLILVSLADGPKHGYAITEDIADFAGVRFGPGSLYGAVSRLESRGLIEALEAEDRRNPYQLTAIGEKALRARLASMHAVAKVGQRRLANA